MFKVLLILIFSRPFISSLAFPYLNSIYSALLLIFLVIWFICKGVSLKKIQSLKYPLILFCLALIISVVFSQDKPNSLKELYKYISGLFLFLIAASLNHKDKIRIIRTIIWTGFIISLLAIYQYFFGFRHLLEYITKAKITDSFTLDYIARKRIFFPFVTPNTLGGYLIVIIPLILGLWNKAKRTFLNPLFFILISISLALLLTKSLGALLSILAGLAIYFIVRDCPRRGLSLNTFIPYLQGNLNKKRLLLIAGLLIIIGVVFLMRQTATKQHILPTFSLIMRINYWIDTLGIIKDNFWTGVGLGNFNLMQSRYAHNSYLQIWAEMGILGIVSFLWLIIAVFKIIFNNIKNSPDKKLITGLISANTAFLIHNLVDFSFFLPEVAFILWLILGLINF